MHHMHDSLNRQTGFIRLETFVFLCSKSVSLLIVLGLILFFRSFVRLTRMTYNM